MFTRDLYSELPLFEHTLIRTSDPDKALAFAQDAFSPMKAEFRHRNPHLEFHLNARSFGQTGLSAQEQTVGGGAIFQLQPDAEKYSLEIPLIGMTTIKIGADEARIAAGRSAVVTSPTKPSQWTDDGLRYRAIALHFNRKLVDHRFRLLTGIDSFDALEFNPHLDLRSKRGAGFLKTVMTLFGSLDAEESIFDNDLSASLYEEFLINSLLTLFPHSRSEAVQAEPAISSVRTVLRAEEYFEEHADKPISISDVAEALGVSVRSLQRTFQYERNTSPMRALKAIRLDRARARLLNGGPKANVTQIAMQSGFTHLGAFASDYRKRFQETPSETLKKIS